MWQTITGWRHGESWGQEGNIECIISITWMGTLELMLCHLWTCLLVTLPPSSAQPAEWWENGRGSAAGDCRVSPCPRDGDQMMLWCDATLLLLIQLSNQLLAHDYNQQSADQVSQWRHLNPQLTSEWRLRNVTVQLSAGLRSANTVFYDGRIASREHDTRLISDQCQLPSHQRNQSDLCSWCHVSPSPHTRIWCHYGMEFRKRKV